MENFETLARITKISKSGKDFYIRAEFENTYHSSIITLEEAAELQVGNHVKIEWWWNTNSPGISSRLVRPIQILIESEPQYRTLK